jgi:hypothetical protein
MENSIKRRRRTPLSCTVCRQKKVKCDRTKPVCYRCLKSHSECNYTSPTLFSQATANDFDKVGFNGGFVVLSTVDSHTTTDSKLLKPSILFTGDKCNEIEKLKNRIKELEQDFDREVECISLVLDYDDTPLATFRNKQSIQFGKIGTFTVTAVWRRDPLMQKFIKNFLLIKKKTTKIDKNTNFVDVYYPQSNLNSTKVPNLEHFQFLNKQLISKKENKKLINHSKFTECIQRILPPLNVIYLYVEYFFQFLYPFIPVIDESIFRKNLSNILIPLNLPDGEIIAQVNVNGQLDMIRLAVLLIFIRLSYLSIYLHAKLNNNLIPNNYEVLLKFPMESDFISIVQSVLFNSNFLRKTSLEMYQLLLLIRFYQLCALEDGDGYFGTSGTIFTGLLVSTSKLIGLQNSFDFSCSVNVKSPNEKLGTKTNNDSSDIVPVYVHTNLITKNEQHFVLLWKKLWWQTLAFDLHQAMIEGSDPQLNHEHKESTNHLPLFDSNVHNVENPNSEKVAIEFFCAFGELNHEISILLKKLNSFKNKPSIVEIDNLLKNVLKIADKVDIEYSNIHSSDSLKISHKVCKMKDKLNVYNLLLVIQCNLLLHCEHICKKDGALKNQAIERYKEIFPNILSRWIWLTEKFISVWLNTLGQSLSDNTESTKSHFTQYMLILGPLLNNIFPKLMLVWFFMAIRLLTFNHIVQNNKSVDNVVDAYKEKSIETKKMYSNLLIIMKTLILIQEKMSKYWYSSLRNYSMFKHLVEWFESGGKFAFDYSTGCLENTHTISDDTNNQYAISVVIQFILETDLILMENFNLKFELMIKNFGLGNVNIIYKQVFSKYESPREPLSKGKRTKVTADEDDNVNYKNKLNDKPILNADQQINFDEYLDNDDPNSDVCFESLNELESFELNDWDDVTKWFNQSTLFECAELDSLNKGFSSII